MTTPDAPHHLPINLDDPEVSRANVQRAAEAVADQVDPLNDFRGSAEYKRDMAVVFTRRALEQVLGLGQ
jgi:CO/xanthine dehydrogenase FAD-binding subunit